MMNASDVIISNCGNSSAMFSTVFQCAGSLTRRYCACTAVYLQKSRIWTKFDDSCVPQMCLTRAICDLLWADPDKDIAGWAETDRGVSFIFGPDVVTGFLQKHDMDLVVR